jgi:hypothetical protein
MLSMFGPNITTFFGNMGGLMPFDDNHHWMSTTNLRMIFLVLVELMEWLLLSSLLLMLEAWDKHNFNVI